MRAARKETVKAIKKPAAEAFFLQISAELMSLCCCCGGGFGFRIKSKEEKIVPCRDCCSLFFSM
jgi:hypothetical protein